MASTVYCDDAGFTGDNLLQPEQPFFGYAAVAIEPEEAEDLIGQFRRRFDVFGSEVKGRLVYRQANALAAITWLLDILGDRASVAVSDKVYGLSCKFFEYVYEPLLARNSLFFYDRGFHLHVATVIWAFLVRGDPAAAAIAARFETWLRRPRDSLPITAKRDEKGPVHPVTTIQRFAASAWPDIQNEVASLTQADGRTRWVLDLSFSSARSVLSTMSQRFGQLDVLFDDSKPLLAYRDFFDSFVGQREIAQMRFRGRDAPLFFNLHKPVSFGSSQNESGLQLADIVASFSALASRDRHTSRGGELFQACLPWFNDESIWPDLEAMRTDRKENFLNSLLLLELADRAEAGADLLAGIPALYHSWSKRFDIAPPDRVMPTSP